MASFHYRSKWDPARQRMIAVHRLVMEREIGRYLETWEHIHHRNGVKTDNRPENLEIVTRAEHGKAHRKIQERACPHCGKVFRPSHQSGRYCSIRCSKLRGKMLPCEQCGTLTWKKPYAERQYQNHFCGAECRNKHRAETWKDLDWETAVRRRLETQARSKAASSAGRPHRDGPTPP